MIAGMSVPMQRYPIFDVASPLRDLVFYEVVDFNIKSNRELPYGTPHHNSLTYPNHVLVHISVNDKEAKTYRFYYAAKRENQDDYNWQINQGSELTRTYIVPRGEYFARSEAERVLDNEFTYPPVATLDAQFPKYGFIEDTVSYADEVLNGHFITIQRKFAEPVVYEIVWSKEYEAYIKIKKEYIPATIEPAIPTVNFGEKIEIKHGNTFHDIKITQTLMKNGENEAGDPYYYEKPSIPDAIDFRLPTILESVGYIFARAWADSTGASPSFDEDYNFTPRFVYPRRGPYQATILRYVTSDPLFIQAMHPIDTVPNEVGDYLTECWAWYYASQDANIAKAKAGEQQLPASIHGVINIDDGAFADSISGLDRFITTALPETPGFSDFIAKTELVVRHQVLEMDLGLYEVQITKLNMTGVYAPPFTIVTQPAPLTTVASGTPVTLSVVVSEPTGNEYQWYTGEPGNQSSPLSGETASSLTITAIATNNYWVKIVNNQRVLFSNEANIVVT